MAPARISIFGLGYVGAVSAACLARDGHTVLGVDPNGTKVDLINRGESPIVEAGLDRLIREAVAAGRLTAGHQAAAAVHATTISIVCVGTPSARNGSLDLRYVEAVCREIGQALSNIDRPHTVVIRSTILPGTMAGIVVPVLREASGKEPGRDFAVLNNPEFLREGSAIHDYDNPPKTVIGAEPAEAAQPLEALYANLPGPKIVTTPKVAELVKYVDNVWHALKVSFANEVGSLARSLGIDSHDLMEIFCQDTKLNISSAYLKPGFAFGGSCLPKDVRALNYRARQLDLDLPVIGAILPSNERHLQRALAMIMGLGRRRVGILGLSFKPGTDDLRESPMVELVEQLIGKGYEVRIYDGNVKMAGLLGTNRDFIVSHIPHIAGLLAESAPEVIESSEVVVIGHGADEYAAAARGVRDGQTIIDLARVVTTPSAGNYQGIAW